MDNKKSKEEALNIAGRVYDVSDYKRDDTLSSGLATTHEQVSDAYNASGITSTDRNKKDSETEKEVTE
ncbi:YozQ family protein [Peribacillus muralis]|uniref:YozQ family protein n=1 Tax=Peribacillus muralis TaxID=264697 RepID=UPI00070BBD88|nr:YozQ family protein [Peribacillus muralis]